MTTRHERYEAYEIGLQKLPGSGLRRLTDFSPYANKVSTRVYDDDGRALQRLPCRLEQQAVPFDLPPFLSPSFTVTLSTRIHFVCSCRLNACRYTYRSWVWFIPMSGS